MRVVLLGPYPPPHGGVQTNLVAIRNFLLSQNLSCEVINLTRFRGLEKDGVYYPANAMEVLWLLLRRRYDIVHLHIGGHLWTRLLGLCLVCACFPGRRTILTFHSGGYPSSAAGKSARPATFRGFVFRRMDGLIAVNQQILDLFRRFGVREERIRLIPPHALTTDAPADGLPPNMETFLRHHRPVLITVGLLEPEYDLGLQLEVLGRIRQDHPEAGLLIVGAGSLEEELRGRIRSLPYADHIQLCGDVPHPVALRAMSESNLFLRTTLYDGDSVAVREALHLGIPVIASNNGMRPEGVTLIPAADPAALRRAIEMHLSESLPPRRQVRTDERNLQAVLDFYRELLS